MPPHCLVFVATSGEPSLSFRLKVLPGATIQMRTRLYAYRPGRSGRVSISSRFRAKRNLCGARRFLKNNRSRAWNRYVQKQITDHVATWAAKYGVPEERWLAPSHGIQFFRADGDVTLAKPQNISQRGLIPP